MGSDKLGCWLKLRLNTSRRTSCRSEQGLLENNNGMTNINIVYTIYYLCSLFISDHMIFTRPSYGGTSTSEFLHKCPYYEDKEQQDISNPAPDELSYKQLHLQLDIHKLSRKSTRQSMNDQCPFQPLRWLFALSRRRFPFRIESTGI